MVMKKAGDVEIARKHWMEASVRASALAEELFQPGSGYGDPEARLQDEHHLQTAKYEAERLFQTYHDVAQRQNEEKLLQLQTSQHLATWASFAVAFAVGVATVISTIMGLAK